jgi:hypothetical protein
MNLLRRKVFARTAFPCNQDRGIADRDHADGSVGSLHQLRFANHAAQAWSAIRDIARALGLARWYWKDAGAERPAAVHRVYKPGEYRVRRRTSRQQLAGVRVQHQYLGVGMAICHHTIKFAGLKVRQHRIKQQDSVVGPVLAEPSQCFRAAASLYYVPTRKSQLLLQLLTKADVWAYHKYIDRSSIFGAF